MPKDRRTLLSLDRSRASPYSCSSKNSRQYRTKNSLQAVGDEKEWEEARCPVCLEHPHNAVLLLCASHDKGCRPYMCDTSYRHSNCLDLFRKSSTATPATDLMEEDPFPGAAYFGRNEEQRLHRPRRRNGSQSELKLLCPLCRGQISGWIVVQPARNFMNSKSRSCSLETCEFSGTYSELREHARLEHPSVRPSEADPQRQSDWMRLERERDFQDMLTASQMESEEDWNDWLDMEFGLDNFFGTLLSDPEDEWDSFFPMDIGLELPFTFLELSLPFDSSTSLSDSIPARTGTVNHSRRRGTTRRGYLSWGRRSNRGQRRSNQR